MTETQKRVGVKKKKDQRMCEREEMEGTLIDWIRKSRMNLKEYMREVMNRDRERGRRKVSS